MRRFHVELAVFALVTGALLVAWVTAAFAGVGFSGELWPWPLAMLIWGAVVLLHGRDAYRTEIDRAPLNLALNVVIYSVMNAVFATGWEPNIGQPLPAGFPWPVIPILAWGAGLVAYGYRVVAANRRDVALQGRAGSISR